MYNPERLCHTIDAATMYKYENHSNIPWTLSQYRTPKMQFDADLQIKKRKWQSLKKDQKGLRYVTKRGFYMDYDLKTAKSVPSTHDHGAQKQWSFEKAQRIGAMNKVDPKLSKNSFLDRIEIQQKLRKVPGVGTYSLQKTIKQKDLQNQRLQKKKQSQGQKIYYYMNTQHLSNAAPGSGAYNPHQPSSKIRLDKKNYKYWVTKHKHQSQRDGQRDSLKPGPSTHKPMNIALTTFDRLATELSKPSKKHCQGTDARFEYTRVQKKKILEQRPSPSNYQTGIEWKGKGVSPKKTSWNDMVWRGHKSGIYH